MPSLELILCSHESKKSRKEATQGENVWTRWFVWGFFRAGTEFRTFWLPARHAEDLSWKFVRGGHSKSTMHISENLVPWDPASQEQVGEAARCLLSQPAKWIRSWDKLLKDTMNAQST